MKRYIVSVFCVLSLIYAASSCVYPFDIESPATVDDVLVVDGDIILGGKCDISLSYLEPLNAVQPDRLLCASVCIEDDRGGSYAPYESYQMFSGGLRVLWRYRFDLSGVPEDRSYRVHIYKYKYGPRYGMFTGNPDGLSDLVAEYASGWTHPSGEVEIGELDTEPDETTVDLKLSFSGDGSGENGAGYYRLDFDEVWEFHTDHRADLLWIDNGEGGGHYEEVDFKNDHYYCWCYASSLSPRIFTSEGLESDVLTRVQLSTIQRLDNRLQILYSIEVHVERISRDYYGYLNNLEKNSNSVGDLFSPNPSELRGNIQNLDDPEELVLGYVEATKLVKKRFYVSNEYYRQHLPSPMFIPDVDNPMTGNATLSDYWGYGYAPVTYDPEHNYDPEYVLWTKVSCVDCVMAGGSKVKPDYWPNDHR